MGHSQGYAPYTNCCSRLRSGGALGTGRVSATHWTVPLSPLTSTFDAPLGTAVGALAARPPLLFTGLEFSHLVPAWHRCDGEASPSLVKKCYPFQNQLRLVIRFAPASRFPKSKCCPSPESAPSRRCVSASFKGSQIHWNLKPAGTTWFVLAGFGAWPQVHPLGGRVCTLQGWRVANGCSADLDPADSP